MNLSERTGDRWAVLLLLVLGAALTAGCDPVASERATGPFIVAKLAAEQPARSELGKLIIVQVKGGTHLSTRSIGGHHSDLRTAQEGSTTCTSVDELDLLHFMARPDSEEAGAAVMHFSLIHVGEDAEQPPEGETACDLALESVAVNVLVLEPIPGLPDSDAGMMDAGSEVDAGTEPDGGSEVDAGITEVGDAGE